MINDAQTVFDMQKDLVSYCVRDILQHCCGKFRHLFMQHASNIDPFKDSITIASACNRVYRQLFLKILCPPSKNDISDERSELLTQVSDINLRRGISEFVVTRKYCNKRNTEEKRKNFKSV